MAYKVIADEVTIPKSLGILRGPNGQEYHEHVNRVYLKGDVVPEDDVSPVFREAVEKAGSFQSTLVEKVDESEVKKAAETQEKELEEQRERLGLRAEDTTAGGDQQPFADYDRLSAKAIVEKLKTMSPGQIERVKRFERDHGAGRKAILEFDANSGHDAVATAEPAKGTPEVSSSDESPEPRKAARANAEPKGNAKKGEDK